jgi:hypothetical protein
MDHAKNNDIVTVQAIDDDELVNDMTAPAWAQIGVARPTKVRICGERDESARDLGNQPRRPVDVPCNRRNIVGDLVKVV